MARWRHAYRHVLGGGRGPVVGWRLPDRNVGAWAAAAGRAPGPLPGIRPAALCAGDALGPADSHAGLRMGPADYALCATRQCRVLLGRVKTALARGSARVEHDHDVATTTIWFEQSLRVSGTILGRYPESAETWFRHAGRTYSRACSTRQRLAISTSIACARHGTSEPGVHAIVQTSCRTAAARACTARSTRPTGTPAALG